MDGLQWRLRYAQDTIDDTDKMFLASILLDFETESSYLGLQEYLKEKVIKYNKRRR